MFQVAVAHQFPILFVPETEGERFKAGKQGNWLHPLKQLMRAVASLQVVIGNSRTKMMNVVIADIARNPREAPRQFKKTTPLQRCRPITPFSPPLPIDSLKLMLHIKQPKTR